MHRRKRLFALLASLVAIALLAAACGSSESDSADGSASDGGTDGGEGATGEPIKIGDVTSVSGPNVFPESATIAKLVFAEYNAAGGLDGRPIELVSADAQDTTEGAAAAAKQLLEEEGVLGFCCGGSIVDCTTNAAYYAEKKVEVLAGVAACAEATTVHPINTGPFLPTLHILDYFVHDLGKTKICFAGLNVGLTPIFQEVFFPMWEADSGMKLTQVIAEVGEDLTPSVTKLASEDCEAVLTAFTEPDYQSFFQIVQAQGLQEEIVWGMLTSGYSLSLLEAAGDSLEGVYAASEFEPYTGDESTFSDEVKDYLRLNEENDLAPTSFGQAGYMSAKAMINALESIDGEITFESVQTAIKNIAFESEMLGGPFEATGFVGGVQPNKYSLMVQVKDGVFTKVSDWRVFPHEG